jgi:hypothetical protein
VLRRVVLVGKSDFKSWGTLDLTTLRYECGYLGLFLPKTYTV